MQHWKVTAYDLLHSGLLIETTHRLPLTPESRRIVTQIVNGCITEKHNVSLHFHFPRLIFVMTEVE